MTITTTPRPDDTQGHMPRIGRGVRPANTARRRSLRATVGAVVAALACLTAVAAAPGADAAIYAGSGTWGYNAPATVTCRYLDAWGKLRTETPPPVAYAANRRAGGGNDAQWVRYRLYYVNAVTGATMSTSAWSGWALAYDNAPARWSGTTMQTFDWRSKIRVDTRIEFYNSTTGAYEGFTAHRADRYHYHNGYTTYPVVLNSYCLKTLAL